MNPAELAEDIKKKQAEALRWKKAIAAQMNLEYIRDRLYEIGSECDEVQWYVDSDDGSDSLINSILGDDEAYEFKMGFADLSATCDRMREDIGDGCYSREVWIPECFDEFFGAVAASSDVGGFMGWDDYEEDYYGLSNRYDVEAAQKENGKRLERLTKKQLIDAAQQCFHIAMAFVQLDYKYSCLKGAMDVLKGENTAILETVKHIDRMYNDAQGKEYIYDTDKDFRREWNKLLEALPQEAWIA